MDAELKARVSEALDSALLNWRKRGRTVPEHVVATTDSEREAFTRKLILSVRNRLRNEGIWTLVQASIAHDELFRQMDRRLKRAHKAYLAAKSASPGKTTGRRVNPWT